MTYQVIECRSTQTILEDTMFEVLTMVDEALAERYYDPVYVGRCDAYRDGVVHRWTLCKRGEARERLTAMKEEIENNILHGITMSHDRLFYIRYCTI